MNITRHIAVSILLSCLIIALIAAHIRYLCWERGEFAVGGEWFVYMLAVAGLIWRFTDDD